MLKNNDTIAAQATPPGRGGISIIRVSGPHVVQVTQQLLKCELVPRQATYLPFYDENNDVLDEGIAIFFPNPHSFTGEDVLELQGHGGPVIVDLILKRLLKLEVRLARPGEFSERAFLNGKLDLTQAEAIADLINATSAQAARSAIRSLQGEFSKEIHQLNEKVIHLRMYVEAAIDFSDEEIDFLGNDKVTLAMQSIMDDLVQIQSKAKQGALLQEGITAVIAGEPNVGKSSLLNALSGKEVAIVTDIPGTTRDLLRDYIQIDGMPMHIIDTAGLRESDDIVEQEGIRRAYHEMAHADVILYVIDATRDVDWHKIAKLEERFTQSVIIVKNKIDLTQEVSTIEKIHDRDQISLSAKSLMGLDLLKRCIKDKTGFHGGDEGVYLARRRHLDALERVEQHVNAAHFQLTTNASGELAAEDLRQAQLALNEITGDFTADDLLGRIFSSFCIGK